MSPAETQCPQEALRRELMRRVRVAVHERDCDTRDTFGLEDVERSPDVGCLERDLDLCIGANPFGDGQPKPPGHERRARLPAQVVHPVALSTAKLQDVTKPPSREQADLRSLSLEQRVQRHGRPVEKERLCFAGAGRRNGRNDSLDALVQRRRSRQRLGHTDVAGCLVVEDQVGERATDVDADADSHQAILIGADRLRSHAPGSSKPTIRAIRRSCVTR